MAATATPHDAAPFQGYETLAAQPLIARLRLCSQVELERVDTYERSHEARPPVLDKLRYLRNHEPLAGYDELEPDQILTSVAGADPATLGRVRAYEMKMRRRDEVLSGLARIRAEGSPTAGGGEASLPPAQLKPAAAGGGPLEGVATVAIFGLIGVAAVLMLVLLAILVFVIIAAVAPDVLIR